MRMIETGPGTLPPPEMRELRGKPVRVYWTCHITGEERKAVGFLAEVRGSDLFLAPEWDEARQAPSGHLTGAGPIAWHRITYFRLLLDCDAPEMASEEVCLEFTRRVMVQAGALVQTAIFGFWKRNGRPSQRSLEALRDRLAEATAVALRKFYGASAGPEWEAGPDGKGALTQDEQRRLFEAWISAPPYEKETIRFPDDPATSWPGQYCDVAVQIAWKAYQAACEEME